MTTTMLACESLLEAATTHREVDQLPYFGALLPQEAVALLVADPQARLVDVRTHTKLGWVDTPGVSPGQFAHVEWNQYSSGARSANFLSMLEATVPKGTPAPFLHRSAARPKHTATATAQTGYAAAMDVLEGFEDAGDTEGHHKTVKGWCLRGLSWHNA